MAFLLSRFFKQFRHNESTSRTCPLLLVSVLILTVAQKRKLLAAAASAGVSVAFGSPLGGVLFGLEGIPLSIIINSKHYLCPLPKNFTRSNQTSCGVALLLRS